MSDNAQNTPAKGSPEEKQAMLAWIDEVAGVLDLDRSVVDAAVGDVLKLTSSVAHNRSRPAAPVTAFLIGLAAGQQGKDPAGLLAEITALAQGPAEA